LIPKFEFYQTVGSITEANSRLLTLFDSSIRRVLGATTSIDVIRNDRSGAMAQVLEQLEMGAQRFGMKIVDVRFGRVVFRSKIARRSISVCRVSVSAKPPSSGR
jgi:membrane protease subunit HflC